MPTPELEKLLRDATILHRLVAKVCDFCQLKRASSSYSDHSLEFFDYVHALGVRTQQFLNNCSSEHLAEEAELLRHRIHLLKGCWFLLHESAKPIADGDSLSTPGPLVAALQPRISLVLSGTKPVLLTTAQMNYFQHPLRKMREIAHRLRGILEGSPPFPSGLAFVSLPYTQAGSVFLNTLLVHEFGHFVLEEDTDLQARLATALEAGVRQILQQVPMGSALEPDNVLWLQDQIYSWASEIFCDLFAIRLIGPVFSLAFLEFRVLGRMDSNTARQFSETHPCDACRFQAHVNELEGLGWWPLISDGQSEPIALLRQLAAIPQNEYQYCFSGGDRNDSGERLGKLLVQMFLTCLPALKQLVATAVPAEPEVLQEFKRLNDLVQEYFSSGVVPSTLVENEAFYHPDPVVVINSSVMFYIDRLDSLLEAIEGKSAGVVADRAGVVDRLEEWTMKAIEDIGLLRSKGATR